AEDGIRDFHVTGVQTCALPILSSQPAELVAETAAKPPVETRDVLLVAQKVDMGERLGTALKWQEWPVTLIDDSFITRERQPDARSEERRVGKECRSGGSW